MNTSPEMDGCCEDEGQQTHRARLKCNHSCHQPQDWRDTLNKIWHRAHIPDFATDAKFAIENLIESLRLKSYEEGRDAQGQIDKDTYRKAHKIAEERGRAAVIDEILAEWPNTEAIPRAINKGKEFEMINNLELQNRAIGYNKGIRDGRAIIESKRTTK